MLAAIASLFIAYVALLGGITLGAVLSNYIAAKLATKVSS